MPSNLVFLAGRKAYQRIRQEGLQADTVKVVAGAAGGPKWLALSHVDRVLFSRFFANRKDPLFLLGSSIGTWRFAAASQRDPLAAIARFEEAYMEQRYQGKPTPQDVSTVSRNVLESFVTEDAVQDILSHPTHRLSIVTARSRWPMARDHKLVLGLGLGGAMLGNALHRQAPHLFFQRTIFSDGRASAPFLTSPDYPSERVALDRLNLRDALMASGSIPFVMAGVKDIAGAPRGVYRDGGVLDYHMNVPFLAQDSDGIVLLPHFGERVIPGWFDKNLPWRQATASFMDHVLLICPSPAFVSQLPFGKIPDRRDFTAFAGRDAERIAYWRDVLRACERLADELSKIIDENSLASVVKPMASP